MVKFTEKEFSDIVQRVLENEYNLGFEQNISINSSSSQTQIDLADLKNKVFVEVSARSNPPSRVDYAKNIVARFGVIQGIYPDAKFFLVFGGQLTNSEREYFSGYLDSNLRGRISFLDFADIERLQKKMDAPPLKDKNKSETSTSSKKRYWAGGFGKGEQFYERLEDFKADNYWQALDYDEDSNQVVAENAWNLFKEIKIGDWFLIKGHGGATMNVHYVGEVINKNESEGRLEFKRLDIPFYKTETPKGPGAGNWFNTLLEVKREEDIKRLFFLEDNTNKNEKTDKGDFSYEDFYDDFDTGETILNNNFSYARVTHDQIDHKDLLGFEKDVRSFASIMALKEVKPPLAIALFGNWGAGKSFFMNSLQKEINHLAKHQAFPGMQSKESNNLFCTGILQIRFNAWSYLDANLWAGLVANIFEKLDEYISEKTKGEAEKQKVREILNEKLEIISANREIIKETREELFEKKKKIKSEIQGLKEKNEELIEEIAEQKWEGMSKEILSKIKLEPELKEQLNKYGISESKLKELSPNAIYNEVTSWWTFFKNAFKLSPSNAIFFIITFVIFLIVTINPNNICDPLFQICKKSIVTFFTIVGPMFRALYSSYSKIKKLFEPVTKLKDDFNNKMNQAKFDFDKKIGLLQAKERLNDKELKIKEGELNELENKISEVEYDLKHSVTKRAFNSFVRAKTKDEKYEQHLGIISTIRRDFETLSELFLEVSSEDTIQISEGNRNKNKKEHDILIDQFKRPLALDRIILYIDDLDRCSEEKVLEVLQAVHLIMAFPLFIVVVGVDKRCVNNALNYKNLQQYKGFTSSSSEELAKVGIVPIEPNEYLEKIFQIPFHVQETSDEGVQNMIDSLMTGQVKYEDLEFKNGDFAKESFMQELPKQDFENMNNRSLMEIERETKEQLQTAIKKEQNIIKVENLLITGIEFKYLKEISFMVSKTPRTVKRFLNLYRIVRAHEGLSYSKENRNEEFMIIMFLLALFNGPFQNISKELVEHFKDSELLDTDDFDLTLGSFLEEKFNKDPLEKPYSILKNRLENSPNFKQILSSQPHQFISHLAFIQRFSFN